MLKLSADRSFAHNNDDENETTSSKTGTTSAPGDAKREQSLLNLRNDVMGSYESFGGPFGDKPLVYADWTASGRCIGKVEAYMENELIPLYGNTHTTTSITGHQSTYFRHEARQIIAESVNAKVTGKAACDVVLFTGHGTTAAVAKLVAMLGFQFPFPKGCDETLRPVVFTSMYEHHSNLLPWRESEADVVTIDYCPSHGVCLRSLKEKLTQYASRRTIIGSFSASSNVTGIMTNVDAVSVLLHQFGGYVFFDYASAAPYVKMDMNPSSGGQDPLAYKDAIMFSGHKFVGGPGTPGVLVVKKTLLPPPTAAPSDGGGGGTVFYVTEDHHRYLNNKEEREEPGTPNLLSDAKLGLVMHIKQTIGAQWIEAEELRQFRYVLGRLHAIPGVVVMGQERQLNDGRATTGTAAAAPPAAKHLPVFSFLVRCGDRFLHYQFVCALLNDLFGVQARGGCMCAGPFSQILLGLDPATNEAIEALLLEKHEVLRPGYTRMSFPFFVDQLEVDYVLDAVAFVAEHGWKFLPLYQHNHKTGEWAHTTRMTKFPERRWLSNFDINAPASAAPTSDSAAATSTSSLVGQVLRRTWNVSNPAELFSRIKDEAVAQMQLVLNSHRKLFEKAASASAVVTSSTLSAGAAISSDPTSFEGLRWFVQVEDITRHGFNPIIHVEDTDGIETRPLHGPIRPYTFNYGATTRPQPSTFTATFNSAAADAVAQTASAYGKKRSEKLFCSSASHRDHNKLPWYLAKHEDQVAASTTAAAAARAAIEPLTEGVCTIISNAQSSEHSTTSTAPSVAIAESGDVASFKESSYDAAKIAEKAAEIAAFKAAAEAPKQFTPPKKMMKLVGQAVMEWGMIEEGDRLLLGLSGGKDSMAMLHTLIALQKKAPVRFEIACATVDPQTSSFDPSPLIPYVESLGVTYHYLSQPIVDMAKSKLQGDSLCAFCSRLKRGLLYGCCREFKYNKLVLAQHLDDLAESFLMSALHNGQIRTMKANYKIEAGDVRVIRPFVYLREKDARDFSVASRFPIINENCPACFEEPKERARMKKLLAQEEAMIPYLFFNLKKAFVPFMDDDTYETMKAVTARIEQGSQRKLNERPASTRGSRGVSSAGAQARTETGILVPLQSEDNEDEEAAKGRLAKKMRIDLQSTALASSASSSTSTTQHNTEGDDCGRSVGGIGGGGCSLDGSGLCFEIA